MQMTPSGKTAIVSSADGLYAHKKLGNDKLKNKSLPPIIFAISPQSIFFNSRDVQNTTLVLIAKITKINEIDKLNPHSFAAIP